MFKTEERVLCFHGPLLYEAKILKSKTVPVSDEEKTTKSGKEVQYLVHYKGWKRTWDEWVREDRIRKWNEENLKHSKELKISAMSVQKKATAAASAATASDLSTAKKNAANGGRDDKDQHSGAGAAASATSHTARGQKRTREIEAEKDEHYKPTLTLQVPDSLKARLVDDWEWITKDQRLVPVPREEASVAHILQEYRLSVPMKRPGSAEAEVFEECMVGLQKYFDKTLGTILLYKFERQQYAEIRKKFGDDAKMSDVYGPEHLLRLFVSMPELVSQTNMDPQAVAVLRTHLQNLLTYLARHEELFVSEYDVTAPSYSRMLNLS